MHLGPALTNSQEGTKLTQTEESASNSRLLI